MRTYLKDSNSKKIFIYMVDSTDHATPETGATVAVKVSKNGAAFGAGGGSVAELEEGVYAYTPSAGDVDTLGPIAFKATASGCDPFIVEGVIVAYDPYDAVRMGQSALPNAAPGANGGLPTTNGTKINQTVDLTAGQSIGISGDLSATMKTSVQTAADAAVTANTKIGAIEADTNELQTNQGNWLTATGFSTHSAADVKTAMEADGSKLDHLWEMTENDGGIRRLTTNALEQAPSGGLDAAGVRAAVGLTSANLDTQLSGISDQTDQLVFADNKVNANASVSLTEGDVTDIADGVAAAIKLTTGWTEGGTLTYAELIKIIAAAVAGSVIDKAGVAGTIQHLDVEDGTTPILENIPSNTTSPYRDITVL